MKHAPTPISIAEAAWGVPLPDWIETLGLACQQTSQSQVAAKLDVSGAAISQLLRNKYAASTDRLQERVRGVFLDGKVNCPALGELPTNECLRWRDFARKFEMASPRRAQMFRACNACPRFTEATDDTAL